MKKVNNVEIRERLKEAKQSGVYAYDVADYLKVCESTFTKWMRHELLGERKEAVLEAIEALTTK